jgi:hypothetical protein
MRRTTAAAIVATGAAALMACHTIYEELPSRPTQVQVAGRPVPQVPIVSIPVPQLTPTPPIPSPSSPVAPAPNPNPRTTPRPEQGGGEPPVTNQSPVVKVNAHVYFVECGGAPVPGSGGGNSAPVGCRIHFDCTGRDASNRPTVPRGTPRWTYSNPGIISGGNSGFNPVVTAKAPGCLDYYAEVDGVRSATSNLCIS